MCENTRETDQCQCNTSCKYKDRETCSGCYISTENSNNTRRCFMTGEYCSQKTNIQQERKKLYKKVDNGITISAFVIMNFSDMSDVVYKWRVEVFVQELKKYLYFDEAKNRLYCKTKDDCIPEGSNFLKVNKVNVIRADSDPASNYIICSRICQQMQIADLIIVDVSSQNPNVFYEFGMAVSLDKLVLPLCFSESFYKLEIPEELREIKLKNGELYKHAKERYAFNHIGCYPWRKRLFEYYGIRYKQNEVPGEPKPNEVNEKKASTHYIPFEDATDENYGFSDIQYDRFPYNNETIDGSNSENKRIGTVIYNTLKESYNNFTKWHNTLVVYTIEGFLNEDQAGLCIINFYHSITEKMQKEKCFRGERVGVLVQDQVIPDSDKDAKQERHLLYNVGEIIHIGVNQATYLASKEKVLAEDVLQDLDKEKSPESESALDIERKKELQRRIKEFIGNRGMIIYPNYPVYVKRITNRTTPDILNMSSIGCKIGDFFCLYHVMLRNLRFTNEIVVDITNNCLQSLFWLGAAHGSEVDAITVKQELSEKERIIIEGSIKDNNRNVFDVSGLWTAHYYSYDTEGFYHQLALAQFGIEKHSKIIPSDAKWHGFKRWEYLELHEPDVDDEEENFQKDNFSEHIWQNKDRLALESFYRRRFWNAMLRYNRLRIYLPQHDDIDKKDGEPRLRAAKWDMDAVSGLTHYLSKRAIIGEYLAITMPESAKDSVAEEVNFICIGQHVEPLGEKLTDSIFSKFQKESHYKGEHINNIHHYYNKDGENGETATFNEEHDIKVQVKGFKSLNIDKDKDDDDKFLRYHPWSGCECCEHIKSNSESGILDTYPVSVGRTICPFIGNLAHTEIAQLILWREDRKVKGNRHFRVSLIGSSGPATFALSSLFVDEGQKLHDFLNDDGNSGIQNSMEQDNCLLYELQEKVRNKIYDLVNKDLKCKIEEIISDPNNLNDKQQKYVALVLYTIHAYLSTVLYRYFLPFITEMDIHRIESGITMFVNTMKASRQSPFCLDYRSGIDQNPDSPEISNDCINDIVKMIPGQVINVIENFRGLEAFYKVKVTHRSVENNFPDAEKPEILNDNISQFDIKKDSFAYEDNCSETKAASYESNTGYNDGNGCNYDKPEMFCKRKDFTLDSRKDNRTVTSIEMMDEISYFMLSSS